MQHAAGQMIGKRESQQDSYHADDVSGLYIVADGMGGHDDGAEASRRAVEVLVERYADGSAPEHAFWAADAHVRDIPCGFRTPGTTAVVLHVKSGRAHIGNIGDSRCYRFSAALELTQVTTDHNLSYAPNVLTRSMGGSYGKDFDQPDFFEVPAEPGDRFLICSDALSDVKPDQLQELLRKALNLPLQAGLELLLEQDTKDNNTIIIVEI